MNLRPYQQKGETDIYEAWKVAPHILYVLPTGGGKTVLISKIINDHNGVSCAIAHRRELVSQISLALGFFGVKHNIIAPGPVVRDIHKIHMLEMGRSYVDANALPMVAGVDTILAREKDLAPVLNQVTLGVQDEAHHVLKNNKWGRAFNLLPNAKWLGVTANTVRADGRGLGRHADGLFDTLITGPDMRTLIGLGYLTDYRIFAPPSDLNLDGVKISANTGDYSPKELKLRVQRSHIVGDVVEHYLRLTPGKIGITFANDLESASDIATRFNAAGVPAEMISAKTKDKIRAEVMRRLRRGDIKQVVNVDLFGEGVDVPAIEVVSMARATASFNLFCQQFGRALRLLDGKKSAYIIDHVGNVMRHGLPDAPQEWTLDRRERGTRGKRDPNVIPVKSCPQCTAVYEAIYKACPYCGYVTIPASRSAPEYVDGDLMELDQAALAAMRGEVDRIDVPADSVRSWVEKSGKGYIIAQATAKRHAERQEAQAVLRDAIALWAGHQRAAGRPDSESYRRFYFNFGVDVMTAQTLGRPEAVAMAARINKTIGR